MPFDGSGTFSRVHNWQEDRDAGIRILADRHDAEDDNFATAFNQTFLRTGTVPMTGNLMMNGNNIMGIKAGTVVSPSLTWELDIGTGFYQPAPKQLALAINGVQRVLWKETGADFAGDVSITGNVATTGTFTAGNLSVTGTLNVAGDSVLKGHAKFYMPGDTASYVHLSNDISDMYVAVDSIGGYILTNKPQPIRFFTNDTEKARLDSAGNFGIGASPLVKLHLFDAAWPTLRLQKAAVGYWDVGVAQGGAGGNSLSLNVNGGPFLFDLNTNGYTRFPGHMAIGPGDATARGMLTILDNTAASTLAGVRTLVLGEGSNNLGYHIVAGIVPVGGTEWHGSIDTMLNGVGGRLVINTSGGPVGIGMSPTQHKVEVNGDIAAYGGSAQVKTYSRDGADFWTRYVQGTVCRWNNGAGDKMTLNVSGDLGLGGSVYPGGHIFLPAGGTYHVSDGSSQKAVMTLASGATWLYSGGANGFVFRNVANTGNVMAISNTGDVYVISALQVGSHIIFHANQWNMSDEGTQRVYFAASDATYMKCGNIAGTGFYWRRGDDALTMQLNNDGTLVATNFHATSDRRLKDNIKPISGALGKLLKVYGHTFNYKNSGNAGAGVMAQDLRTVLPELVHTDEEGMLSVNYNGLVAYLLEAVRDLQNSINSKAMAASYK